MLENGTLVDGKYRILHEIGRGGMSVVYLALNERANKTWAVKEVKKSSEVGFETIRQGLTAEINIMKKLDHPLLPSIVDVIAGEDSFLVVMDYIEGVSLGKLLRTEGPQPWSNVIEWGKQLCDVLEYLHNQDPPIIYRDMKPDNIQLKPDGNITLLDFGTAREFKYQGMGGTDTAYLGTRGYAAPEQYGGMGETDARTDIYCLGATMYHLVTGCNPGLPPYEIKPVRMIDPALPRGLEMIIAKCTQQDPELRYQNCLELMVDLENIYKLDEAYRNKQLRKLRSFEISVLLTIFFATISIASGIVIGRRSDELYERYVSVGDQAAKGVEYPGDLEYRSGEKAYMEAIKLKPHKKKAYLALARLYVIDGNNIFAVSSEEEANMRVLISSNKIDKSMDEYAEVAFIWGSYLYFYFRDSTSEGSGRGSPKLAGNYLQAAGAAEPLQLADSVSIGNAKKELAIAMASIAKGEELMDDPGNSIIDSVDEEYDYMSYWEDLNILVSPGLRDSVIEVNSSTVYLLSLYRTVVNTLYENMFDFHKTKEEIEDMVSAVEINCKAVIANDPKAFINGSAQQEILNCIYDQINAIRQKYLAFRTGGR